VIQEANVYVDLQRKEAGKNKRMKEEYSFELKFRNKLNLLLLLNPQIPTDRLDPGSNDSDLLSGGASFEFRVMH
jgi:hypothetical protein